MIENYRYYQDSNGKWTIQQRGNAQSVGNTPPYWFDLPIQEETEDAVIAAIKRLRAADDFKPVYKYVEDDDANS